MGLTGSTCDTHQPPLCYQAIDIYLSMTVGIALGTHKGGKGQCSNARRVMIFSKPSCHVLFTYKISTLEYTNHNVPPTGVYMLNCVSYMLWYLSICPVNLNQIAPIYRKGSKGRTIVQVESSVLPAIFRTVVFSRVMLDGLGWPAVALIIILVSPRPVFRPTSFSVFVIVVCLAMSMSSLSFLIRSGLLSIRVALALRFSLTFFLPQFCRALVYYFNNSLCILDDN